MPNEPPIERSISLTIMAETPHSFVGRRRLKFQMEPVTRKHSNAFHRAHTSDAAPKAEQDTV
jgi:hypothetical protein